MAFYRCLPGLLGLRIYTFIGDQIFSLYLHRNNKIRIVFLVMLKQYLHQKLQQRLSSQQIQLIRLLELPALELEDRIQKELEENPALEEGQEVPVADSAEKEFEADDASDTPPEGDLSLGDYLTEDDMPDYKLAELYSQTDRREEMPFSPGVSLQEYLLEQLQLRELSDLEQQIGEYIIGNIDDDGYLRRELTAITDDLIFKAGEQVEEADVVPVLKAIQELDPPGIAARDLQECLLLQLKHKRPTEAVQTATIVLTNHFDAFARKHYEKILKSLNINEDLLKEVLHEITALNPKPGNNWSGQGDLTSHQITPDFIVEAHNGELILTMNQHGIPPLHVNHEYAALFQDYTGNKMNQTNDMRDAVQFVKQKLDAAQWFIDAVNQRQETLERTMQAILSLQKNFFLTGDETKLKPMILRDVAERSGYDISTISRVSNSKYVQTNFGIYPLRFFFSDSTQNDSGEEISTREVKKIMKETIDAEDKRKPIADDALKLLLKEKGYVIARRTVAKYREHMGIPVARLRKEL